MLYEVQLLREDSISEYMASRRSELNESNRDQDESYQSKCTEFESEERKEKMASQVVDSVDGLGSDPLHLENSLHRKRKFCDEETIFRQKLNNDLEEKKLLYKHEERMKQLELDHEYRLQALEVECRRVELEKVNKEMLNTMINIISNLSNK